MHINKVVSFLNSWHVANVEFKSQLQDIQTALNTFHDEFLTKTDFELPRESWGAALTSLGWESGGRTVYTNGVRTSFAALGPWKDGVAATPATTIDILGRWLFQRSSLAVRLQIVRMPILLLPTTEYARRLSNRFMSRVPFESVKKQLDALVPLSHSTPFLILGYSDMPDLVSPEVDELTSYFTEQNRLFERSIEFPPEYHQAGIGILSFFGTYLRERYPRADAVVRIEQDGLKVRLIVQGKDGAKEVVEKALQEYELVVSQAKTPESVVADPRLILELRQEIRIAQVRIESQRDIISLQEGRIDHLLEIIGAGLAKPSVVTIDFKPRIALSNVQTDRVVSSAIETLEELKDLLPVASPAQLALDEVQQSLETIEREEDPTKVQASSALEKLRAFLEKARESSSELRGVIEATGSAVDAVQRLAGKYNRIAEWCGLPQVPSVFTK
ncbi:hypothetical protein [Uliginosibacterium sp. H1]|uniref:hypothetical protein n=1 Tax=Uliginosibacterium sp. H1 TaxID=3114757 RepID=UPI002E19B552|nr:hypothetical protein [Uliginosibacterium sp. H1]